MYNTMTVYVQPTRIKENVTFRKNIEMGSKLSRAVLYFGNTSEISRNLIEKNVKECRKA